MSKPSIVLAITLSVEANFTMEELLEEVSAADLAGAERRSRWRKSSAPSSAADGEAKQGLGASVRIWVVWFGEMVFNGFRICGLWVLVQGVSGFRFSPAFRLGGLGNLSASLNLGASAFRLQRARRAG